MQTIKLPHSCAYLLAARPELTKAFLYWARLKLLVGKRGFLFNYKTKKKHYAELIGITENTLRKYVGVMKQNGLAWESNNNLRFSNQHQLYTIFNLEPHICDNKDAREKYGKISTRQIRFKAKELTIGIFRLKILSFKKKQYAFKAKEKIVNVMVERVGNIICSKIKKKVEGNKRKLAEAKFIKLDGCIRYNYIGKKKIYGHIDSNLSATSFAKLFGRKSGATGSRMYKALADAKLITIKRRAYPLCKVSPTFNMGLIREVYGNAAFLFGSMVYITLTNRVIVNESLNLKKPVKTEKIKKNDKKNLKSKQMEML